MAFSMSSSAQAAKSVSGSFTPSSETATRSAVSGEEAHTTWTNQQSHDDEHNTPKNLASEQRDNACDNEDYRNYPKNCCHDDAPFRQAPTGLTPTAVFGLLNQTYSLLGL